MVKTIIARNHLERCDVKDCKFSHPSQDHDYTVCCFGLRGEGCIYVNREMQLKLKIVASVEARLTMAKYNADPWWAAETRNDQIDFPEINDIIEPIMEKVAKITKKVYNFVYNGHEYIHSDNSMDYKSCPECDSIHKELIGYYGNGQGRIACFECQKCFNKFYYHKPE